MISTRGSRRVDGYSRREHREAAAEALGAADHALHEDEDEPYAAHLHTRALIHALLALSAQ